MTDVLTFYMKSGARSATTAYSIDRLLDWWHDKRLSDVKRTTCEAYVGYRTAQPIRQAKKAEAPKLVTAETARRELTVLRAAIRAYHAETPLDALPVVTLPEASAGRPDWLRRHQVAKLLRAARKIEDRDAGRAIARLILIGVYTGTRSGAMRRLGWLPNTLGGLDSNGVSSSEVGSEDNDYLTEDELKMEEQNLAAARQRREPPPPPPPPSDELNDIRVEFSGGKVRINALMDLEGLEALEKKIAAFKTILQ